MKLTKAFKGIHRRSKAITAPVVMKAPKRIILPLRQHRGAPAMRLVEPGQEVKQGQLIGQPEEFDSAAVHSPVSGTVLETATTTSPSGQKIEAVVIASDGNETKMQADENALAPVGDAEAVISAEPDALMERIKQAGVVRALTIGLPLQVELSPAKTTRSYLHLTDAPIIRTIDTLIIKALDFDPPVTPNQALLAGGAPDLEIGVLALKNITGAADVILALPPGGVSGDIKEMAERREWKIAVVDPSHYPYGLNSMVVHKLTGRSVPLPYGEPQDVGVAIEPLITAVDVGRVLATGKPMTHRVFTVAGDVPHPGSFIVPLGTPILDVIKEAGGFPDNTGKTVIGGPMMGYAHFDLNTPVTKETNGVFLQSRERLESFRNHPCIHCGRCAQVCPISLIPGELGKACEFGDYQLAAEKDLFLCVECGCCAYVCPAKRPLVQLIRLGKNEILSARKEQ